MRVIEISVNCPHRAGRVWPHGPCKQASAKIFESIRPLNRPPPKKRVIVVTGTSAGVGLAAVRAFPREDAKIGLLARGRDGLEMAWGEIEKLGGNGLVLPVDVADAARVDAAAEVEQKLGRIEKIRTCRIICGNRCLAITARTARSMCGRSAGACNGDVIFNIAVFANGKGPPSRDGHPARRVASEPQPKGKK